MSIFRKISALTLALGLSACALAGCAEDAANEVSQEETTPIIKVGVYISAPDADSASSPAILHIAGGEVDFYHASPANTDDTLELAAGEYTVEVIAPINADGSTYETCEAQTLVLEQDGPDAMIAFDLVLIEADKVTAGALEDLLAKVSVAVSSGDETLCGDAGLAVIELFQANAKAAPQGDEEKIEQAAVAATGAVAATPKSTTSGSSKTSSSTNAAGTPTSSSKASSTSPSSSSTSNGTSSNTSSSSASSSSSSSSSSSGTDASSAENTSSSSGGGSSSTPAHTHSWVATYKTVNHEAVYETVYHPAVYKSVTVCKGCGEISPSEEHLSAHISNHTGGGTRQQTIKVSDAWEETVCVSEAREEQVVTGYTCSCGATKAA